MFLKTTCRSLYRSYRWICSASSSLGYSVNGGLPAVNFQSNTVHCQQQQARLLHCGVRVMGAMHRIGSKADQRREEKKLGGGLKKVDDDVEEEDDVKNEDDDDDDANELNSSNKECMVLSRSSELHDVVKFSFGLRQTKVDNSFDNGLVRLNGAKATSRTAECFRGDVVDLIVRKPDEAEGTKFHTVHRVVLQDIGSKTVAKAHSNTQGTKPGKPGIGLTVIMSKNLTAEY